MVYADELAFNPYGVRAKSWAATGMNQPLRKGGLKLPPLYGLVLMTASTGLFAYLVSPHAILIQDALELFSQVHSREQAAGNPRAGEQGSAQAGKTLLFWDNLPMHRSRVVLEGVRELGWAVSYNAPYSSAWHCIEAAFA